MSYARNQPSDLNLELEDFHASTRVNLGVRFDLSDGPRHGTRVKESIYLEEEPSIPLFIKTEIEAVTSFKGGRAM